MSTPEQTIVELSRKKIILCVLGSCIFVASGIWMVSLGDDSILSMSRLRSPTYVHGVGIASIVLFGFFGTVALTKLLDRKPGLTFNAAGIIDNSSGVSAGLIPWSEIMGAKPLDVHRQKILLIEVKEPQKYLGRGNWLKQFAVNSSCKMYGSPIAISAVTLKTSFPELLSLFYQYQQKYGSAKAGN
jgi:hypothetical protein